VGQSPPNEVAVIEKSSKSIRKKKSGWKGGDEKRRARSSADLPETLVKGRISRRGEKAR